MSNFKTTIAPKSDLHVTSGRKEKNIHHASLRPEVASFVNNQDKDSFQPAHHFSRVPVFSNTAVQSKLKINRPGDWYEQEADKVADRVMTMSAPGLQGRPGHYQGAGISKKLQRKEVPAASTMPSAGSSFDAPPIVNDVLNSGGKALDNSTRSFMESQFEQDFSQVRIHTDSKAIASAKAVSANAYTVGTNIVFNEGRYAQHTPKGLKLLAHELAHVVQQSASALPERNTHKIAPPITPVGEMMLARDVTDDYSTLDEEEKKKRASQATMTAVTQRRPNGPKPLDLPVREINDPKKGKGTLGEALVPGDRYSGWDWNHIGGGSETASSRTNLARTSSHDKRMNQEGTAGMDFLVENVKTGRLVIGEQKATAGSEFTKTGGITTNLEKNIAHSAQVLQQSIDSGKVKEPAEVARLQQTIDRLKATQAALENGRLGKPSQLPEGVVFEFTNVGGGGKQIGKEHIDLLNKEYGKDPAFLEHILGRTFVRDAELAKAKGRDPGGHRGTDADPEIVPASELLTPQAKDNVERLRAGKSEKQWKVDKARQQAEESKVQRKKLADERKAQREQRAAAEARMREQARQMGERARQEHLKQLQQARAGLNEAEPKNARERAQSDRKMEREAGKTGKITEKSSIDNFLTQRKQQESDAKARRVVDAKIEEHAWLQQREAARRVQEQRKAQERLDVQQKAEARRKAEEAGSLKTPESIQKMNEEAKRNHASEQSEARMGKVAHAANQVAGGIRAYDTYNESREKGKGRMESALDAGMTYLENTNPLFGTIATAQQRQQKDESGQQYYGNDAMDAWLGTLGETGAGFMVPGSGVDQLVNAGANVTGAVDDHIQKGRAPNDPSTNKANLRTGTDLAADLTPSRMFAQTMGAGVRAYYDIGRAMGGDTTGVDKFADDMVRGKMGSVLQPWAMAADFVGNLGGDSAGVALEKTLKKSEGTTLKKIGDASGDAMYNLGQSKEAKSGKYGAPVQGISMALGVTSDLIAGKSFEKALEEAAEAGKGSLADTVGSALGDAAFKTVEKGKEFINEDLPAAKKKVEDKIDATKKQLSNWWNKL